MEQSAYLGCLPLQEGHFGQQAVAVTGLRVEVITHSTKQVRSFFQVLLGLIQQTCSGETGSIYFFIRFCLKTHTEHEECAEEGLHLS